MDINDLLDMINKQDEPPAGTPDKKEGNQDGQVQQTQTQTQAPVTTPAPQVVDVQQPLVDAVDGVKFNSIIQMEIGSFFSNHRELNKEPIKSTILNTAFNMIKSGMARGQTIPIATALDKSAESYRTQLVNHLTAGTEMLTGMTVKKDSAMDDFQRKVESYTQDDFLREYDKEILPSMTVKGMHTIRVEKGYGKEREIVRDGTADHPRKNPVAASA